MHITSVTAVLAAAIALSIVGPALAKETDPRISAAFAPQVAACWSMPSETSVVHPILKAELNRDGSVKAVSVANHSEEPVFKVYAETARRAVLRCSPYDLSAFADKYEDWRELTLNFEANTDLGPPKWQNKATGATSLLPNFTSGGRVGNGLTQQATSWDGRDVMVMFMCVPEEKPDGFAIGVDFGVGRDQTKAQRVTMMYGETTDKRKYQRIVEYVGFEGKEAADHLRRMADAKGYLEFAGENGHSALFRFDDMKNEYRTFLDLCGLDG